MTKPKPKTKSKSEPKAISTSNYYYGPGTGVKELVGLKLLQYALSSQLYGIKGLGQMAVLPAYNLLTQGIYKPGRRRDTFKRYGLYDLGYAYGRTGRMINAAPFNPMFIVPKAISSLGNPTLTYNKHVKRVASSTKNANDRDAQWRNRWAASVKRGRNKY